MTSSHTLHHFAAQTLNCFRRCCMLGMQAFCIVSSASFSFVPQSDQSKMITIVANGFAEVERQADEPGFVLSCRIVTMPATSTPVEDPLGGFSGGFVKEYGMRDAIRRHYKVCVE